jgi:hypothetical protein
MKSAIFSANAPRGRGFHFLEDAFVLPKVIEAAFGV